VKRNSDGTLVGGFYAAGREVEAISAIEAKYYNRRFTPTLTTTYSPRTWFNNRLTVGADVSGAEVTQYFPKNDQGWYQGDANTGDLTENRLRNSIYTLDYLGRIQHNIARSLEANLSFGTQVIVEQLDRVTGEGTGFVTNANRVIGAATQISAEQDYEEQRSIGVLGQVDLGYAERLYLNLGARLDQNSNFGGDTEPFFLPKVGASYVVSEERFWAPVVRFVPTLRLRAAYGETGRSPDVGASLETYDPSPFAIYDGGSGAGVRPLNPGNQNLRAERGKEFEAGFDAGFLNDRFGAEVTYFKKTTTDLLLERPVPPSSGFSGVGAFPFANIGKVRNTGIEYAVRATLLDINNVRWSARVAGSTLDNELVSLGDVEPFGTLSRFEEGHPLGSYFTRKIRSVNTTTDTVIVSEDLEYVGSSLPTSEGNFSSDLTLFNLVSLRGLLEWKRGFMLYNNTAQFRDRSFRNSRIGAQCATATTEEECLRRYGPFVSEESNATVAFSQVNEEYLESGNYLRLRELSATVTAPQRFANRLRASSASFTLAARNIALWTDYTGDDPEVISDVSPTTGFLREEFFTVPQPLRFVIRANVTF
jgi:outer membrane receptor protein involved in Fe transport